MQQTNELAGARATARGLLCNVRAGAFDVFFQIKAAQGRPGDAARL